MEPMALRSQNWETSKTITTFIQDMALMQGERAAISTKGGTFRRESLRRVTSSCLEHTNCNGVAKPTRRQVAGSAVLRVSVVADNSASAARFAEQLRLQNGVACGKPLVRRAKEEVLKEMYAEDTRSVGLLPSYLRELSVISGNLWTEIYRDSSSCFERAVIIIDAQLSTNGQQAFGVDAAHMKHRHYNGVQIILVAQNGDMENKIAAVALAPTKNTSNYKWFFGILLARGCPLFSVPIFSYRHLSIVSAAETLNVRVHFCTQHIVAAKSEAVFSASLGQFAAVNEPAAFYLRSLQSDRWGLSPYFKTSTLYGWRTIAEAQAKEAPPVWVLPRVRQDPSGKCFKRLRYTAEWRACSHRVTPKLQHEMMKVPSYVVAFSSGELCCVFHRLSSLESSVEVNIGAPSCSCAVWMQHGLLCVHLLAAFQAADKTDKVPTLFASCYITAAYSEHLQPLRLPSEAALTMDKSIRPSPLYAQAERPRKRRARSRDEQRSRDVYRCRQRGTRDGHNTAACRHK